MKKNGFTLVELLAIIVILGLIMVLAAPNLGNQMKKNEENTKSILNSKIENASKLYVAKYYASSVASHIDDGEDYTSIKFTLDELQRDGLLSLKGNDSCNGVRNNEIKVAIGNGKVEYTFKDISNNNACFDCDAADNKCEEW